MIPSLFSLFKRGRYYRSTYNRACNEESRESREEKERFITASIGLCFRHDPEHFRNHFFHTICQRTGDPELQFGKCSVTLEDENFDLLIINRIREECFVYVVEAKVRAGLQNNQNPEHKKFWKDANYGAKMLRRFSVREQIRYVILGYDNECPTPQSIPARMQGRFELVQKNWSHLAENTPTGGLCQDFADLLTRLGIEAFMLRQTNDLRLTGDLRSGVDAYLILSDTCTYFGLPPNHWSLGVAKENVDDPWFFGVEFKKNGFSGKKLRNQKSLTELVQPAATDGPCWFGYEAGGKRTVWFYCGTTVPRKRLQKLLMAKGIPNECHAGSEYVFATMPNDWKGGDRDWFVKVLTAAGMKKARI